MGASRASVCTNKVSVDWRGESSREKGERVSVNSFFYAFLLENKYKGANRKKKDCERVE
jgi:hypothetical protein